MRHLYTHRTMTCALSPSLCSMAAYKFVFCMRKYFDMGCIRVCSLSVPSLAESLDRELEGYVLAIDASS